MTVDLSVQEAQVTSEQIPIKVNSVKKDGVPVTSGLTYEYKCEALDTNEILEKSLDEFQELWDTSKTVDVDSLTPISTVKEEKQDEATYTFSGLEQEKCYKITVTVIDGEENTGTKSVGILGFKISKGESPYEDSYYRAMLGSTVGDWIESGYSKIGVPPRNCFYRGHS